jgi:hypothetical protein
LNSCLVVTAIAVPAGFHARVAVPAPRSGESPTGAQDFPALTRDRPGVTGHFNRDRPVRELR